MLATHPTLHYIADPRVLLSVRKLKRLSATEVEKGSKKVPVLPLIPAVTSSPIIEVVREHESGEVDEELESTTKKQKISPDDDCIKNEISSETKVADNVDAAVDETTTEIEPKIDTGLIESASNSSTDIEATLSSTDKSEPVEIVEVDPIEAMTVGEAKEYRMSFIAACRYYYNFIIF